VNPYVRYSVNGASCGVTGKLSTVFVESYWKAPQPMFEDRIKVHGPVFSSFMKSA
jgi:hypothetical protein